MILRDVEVEGRRVDVVVHGPKVVDVTAVGESRATRDAEEIDGHGDTLLPGLHDHHLHLRAFAAARSSVDCRGGLDGLVAAAKGAGPSGAWIRGIGFPGSVDRHTLDQLVPDRPVRVQHRSGALWMLNSAALSRVVLDDSADVERDDAGQPTGRLWRYDSRLRPHLPQESPSLDPVVDELHALGITSVTDATPDLDAGSAASLRQLPLDVTALGDPAGQAPLKILLRDHDLPGWDELAERVRDARRAGRPVAVHCVTRHSLVLTLAVLDELGRLPGDRIEHAAVVPDPGALHDLQVVTQPAFVAERGDDYLRDVDDEDLPHLYRYASLLAAEVQVLPSSDAPYGPLDPWKVMRAARDRRTASGRLLGPGERTPVRAVLDGYLCDATGAPRRIRPGAPARLVLLHGSMADVVGDPSAERVRAVFDGGSEWIR